MSTLQNNPTTWSIPDSSHDSKYKKCLHITQEIYKRINITFEIKKLETGSTSDISNSSEQIDSNDISNETDLFAYDKSSSISSSVSDLTAQNSLDKFINLNNNEESKFKKIVPYVTAPRPRKRFRKRVKKRPSKCNRQDTDYSSDEGVPLSRIVDNSTTKSGTLQNVDKSKKEDLDEKKIAVNDSITNESNIQNGKNNFDTKTGNLKEFVGNDTLVDCNTVSNNSPVEIKSNDFSQENGVEENKILEPNNKGDNSQSHTCLLCNATFRGNRGLKRHMTMSHITSEDSTTLTTPHT